MAVWSDTKVEVKINAHLFFVILERILEGEFLFSIIGTLDCRNYSYGTSPGMIDSIKISASIQAANSAP